ncbi:MAG: NusG domain II-containing protein [Mariprofundaceae bacterium]
MNPATHGAGLRHALAGTPADRWLLATLILTVLAGWWQLHAHAANGPTMVEIRHGDTVLARYPLDAPAPIRFHARGDLGESLIVIEHGAARIADSPCNTRYCVHSGAHRRAGDIIVCVPNRILVALVGGKRLDAVAE